MLLGRALTVKQRVWRVLLAVAVAVLPALLWYILASLALIPWPQASGPLGVTLGILGAMIIVFEMALTPRKWLRGMRLGATRVWMRWHVWLGLAVLPIIVIHSGFAWGGWLSATTMVLFLLVIASGVYGLVLQQYLPKKIYDEIPNETIASQVDTAIRVHVKEAENLVASVGSPRLMEFYTASLAPYLERGAKASSALASATESSRLFARLRAGLPVVAEPNIHKLESIAALRRQWDRQVRLNRMLHAWQMVHLPISVLMTGLMVIHAILAMKWW